MPKTVAGVRLERSTYRGLGASTGKMRVTADGDQVTHCVPFGLHWAFCGPLGVPCS